MMGKTKLLNVQATDTVRSRNTTKSLKEKDRNLGTSDIGRHQHFYLSDLGDVLPEHGFGQRLPNSITLLKQNLGCR